jgi:hypothetical protein
MLARDLLYKTVKEMETVWVWNCPSENFPINKLVFASIDFCVQPPRIMAQV